MKKQMRCAFSLIELSIVLVILGLLTGGILSGQSLIRAAELRSVSADMSRYRAAIYSFRDKYFALPGDMNNATKFWGTQNATAATCYTTASSDSKTCDGNGDGKITTLDGGTTYSEYFRAWQHLANAGLIEGSYSGVASTCGSAPCAAIRINIPAGRISSTGFSFAYLDPITSAADANWFVSPAGNFLWFGTPAGGYDAGGLALKPEEAWNIDTKLDDGMPSTGAVMAQKAQTSCYTGSSPSYTYALTSTSLSCSMMFLLKV